MRGRAGLQRTYLAGARRIEYTHLAQQEASFVERADVAWLRPASRI
jgi:hypothetical protein